MEKVYESRGIQRIYNMNTFFEDLKELENLMMQEPDP
jgi:hypothetical protein